MSLYEVADKFLAQNERRGSDFGLKKSISLLLSSKIFISPDVKIKKSFSNIALCVKLVIFVSSIQTCLSRQVK
jgi:hypothetical protein